jgi:hypothetical protein
VGCEDEPLQPEPLETPDAVALAVWLLEQLDRALGLVLGGGNWRQSGVTSRSRRASPSTARRGSGFVLT